MGQLKCTQIMIPNHKQFIEAIKEKKKVCLRFYSKADSGVLDLVCAPMDYGLGSGARDGLNRYWFWDYTSNTGSPSLGLLAQQVIDLRILGQVFDPADFTTPPVVVLPPAKLDGTNSPEAPTQSPPLAQVQPALEFPSS